MHNLLKGGIAALLLGSPMSASLPRSKGTGSAVPCWLLSWHAPMSRRSRAIWKPAWHGMSDSMSGMGFRSSPKGCCHGKGHASGPCSERPVMADVS